MQRIGISKLWFITSIVLLSLPIVIPISSAQQLLWGNEWTGPWVGRIIFEPIFDDTQQVLALINGDVDIIGGQIDPILLDQLYEATNVQVSEVPQYGCGILNINCLKYPFNISNFRRALAFAIDKTRIIDEGWLGHADLLDCHIPQQHPAYIENEMDFHYYDRDLEKGSELLQFSGFNDTDNDGWLEGPSLQGPGSVELDSVVVECSPSRQNYIFCDEVVQALRNLSINAESRISSFANYNNILMNHEDYDMIISEYEWNKQDLDSYARKYSSHHVNTTNQNPSNWINETWDDLAQIVLYSTDFTEISAAAKEMEHIWVEDCPGVVLYQSRFISAYRTDSFEGVIIDSSSGAPNFFTNLRIHNTQGDVLGGTYTWAIPLDIESFNPFSSNNDYAQHIFDITFDSLVRIDPNGNDILWMCEDFLVQTHSDNSDIPDGHTRIIVNIIENSTWSDGQPITAEDFAFSIQYIHDNVPSFAVDLEDLFACYSYTPTQLYCEFSTESYWHWHAIAYKYVIPQQIWTQYGINYDGYQPTPDTLHHMLISGPFVPNAWVQGDFIELIDNEYYWKNPRHFPRPTEHTTTNSEATSTSTPNLITTSNSIPTSSNFDYSWFWLIAIIVEMGLCVYIALIWHKSE